MSSQDWDTAEALLRTWQRRAREGQHMHHEAAKYFRRAHYVLTVPTIVISATIGTATFATMTSSLAMGTKIWFGSLNLVVAALTALQLNFRYLEKAEKHKNLGAQFGNIRRGIESTLALGRDSRGEAKAVLADLRSQLDRLSAEGDAVSRRIYNRTLSQLAERDRRKVERPDSLPQP